MTAFEAALGAALEVPTLRGKVSMKIRDVEWAHLQAARLRMPRPGGGGAGDQLVAVRS